MRFTAKTSSADFSYGVNDDDDDGGVVNDGDGLAWVLAKDPTVCVAHTPRDGSSAAVQQRKYNATRYKSQLAVYCSLDLRLNRR